MDTRRLLHFIYVGAFDRSTAALLDDEAMRLVELALIENPWLGALVAGTGGLRKLRVAPRDRGKRGGYRLLYLLIELRSRIYFVAAFAKNVQADLSREDFHHLARVARDLKLEV